MDEDDFWLALEFRVCGEMDGIEEFRREGMWCDGFSPWFYALDRVPGEITGRVWIGFGSRTQEEWEFKLILHSAYASPKAIPWENLLPPDDVTEWLVVERAKKRRRLVIDLAVAAPC